MPKRLLRGVIDFEDGRLTADATSSNFKRLRASRIEWWNPVDEKLYSFVKEFFETNLAAPTERTVLDYFRASNNMEAEERLKDLKATPTYERQQYSHLLRELVEGQDRAKMRTLIKETDEIVTKGLDIGVGREKVRLVGIKDALVHFVRGAQDLVANETIAKTRGELRGDVEAAWAAYQEAKHGGSAYGKLVGLQTIDAACHGCKRGELWVHAGFAGEMKSNFALNWALNLMTRYRTNVFYVCLEMPYEQIQKRVYVLHSANPKWRRLGYPPLDYRRVRDGELTPKEEVFYQLVLKDFYENPEHCLFEVWCPERDVTIADIRVEAELRHRDMEVGLLVVDHTGLLNIPKRDYGLWLNHEVREAKKMALQFAGGEGVAVLLLHQLNREGKKAADRAGGVYGLHALSYANEAEKSADYVTTSYLNDQLREDGQLQLSNLKNRDNPLFGTTRLCFDKQSLRLFEDSAATVGVSIDSEEDLKDLLSEL